MEIAYKSPSNCVNLTPNARIFTRAFTMIELIVILVIMVLFLAFLIPAMVQAKAKAKRIACVGRLKNIGLAHRIFAVENTDLFPWEKHRATTNLANFPNLNDLTPGEQVVPIFQSLSNELSTPKIIVCPADTRRAAVDWRQLTTNNISYFLGMTAQETYPQTILGGDRNLVVDGFSQRHVEPGPAQRPGQRLHGRRQYSTTQQRAPSGAIWKHWASDEYVYLPLGCLRFRIL